MNSARNETGLLDQQRPPLPTRSPATHFGWHDNQKDPEDVTNRENWVGDLWELSVLSSRFFYKSTNSSKIKSLKKKIQEGMVTRFLTEGRMLMIKHLDPN